MSRRPLRQVFVYLLMLAGGAGAFLLVREVGSGLAAPPGGVRTAGAGTPVGSETARLLLALAVIVVAARLVAAVFTRLRQPAVIGEILAGILLGPSVLGRLCPGVMRTLLPPTVAPSLSMLAQLGVVVYMFLVGLNLDLSLLRTRAHAAVAVSHASIVVPFTLGTALSLLLYEHLSSASVPFTDFALFCGVAMSVTAFPVLARILSDRGIDRTRIGVIALSCAAVDDITAWCLLAFVIGVVKMHTAAAVATSLLTLAYLLLMIYGVRPLLARTIRAREPAGGQGELGKASLALILAGLLVSALATEAIGVHAVFGAFMLGAVIPHDSKVAPELIRRLEDFVVVLLLPVYFAFTGMRTQIGLISGAGHWALCALIVLTACLGKFGGSLFAARFTGLPWRESAALGVLMNTRGLMELVVLNIGLDLGVISPTLFAMLVIMALVTTMATTPILDAIIARPSPAAAPPMEAERPVVSSVATSAGERCV
jgi:Kef-type K+ transport system membrane component KefB